MNNFNKLMEKNISKFYVLDFLKSMLFFIPILVLFFQNRGLNMTEILLIQSIYSVFVIFMEIPTGILADKFGHKNSMVLSLFFFTLGIGLYYFSYSFSLFLVAELLMGFGTSLFSGSSDSFLFETLKKLGKEKSYKKISGVSTNYSLIGYFISSLLGGFIASYFSFNVVILITFGFYLIAFFISLSLKDPHLKGKSENLSFLEIISTSSKFIFKDKTIFWVFLFYSIFMMFNLTIEWFYQPYLKLINLDLKYFGVVFSFMALSAIPISTYSHFIEEKLGFRKSLILASIFLFSLFLGLYLINSIFSILFLVLVPSAKIFLNIINNDFILKKVSSSVSASVLSFFSMGKQFTFALFAPFLGYLFDVYGLYELIFIDTILLGYFFIVLVVLYLLFRVEID